MSAEVQPVTAVGVLERLRCRYPYPEWLVADEVTLDYQGKTFRVDAIAANLWVSRGLHLHGFEIKVSRSDWLKELQCVGKCEAGRRFCDRWWLVSPPDVAKREELPEGWGWIQTNGVGLRIAKQAPHNESPDKLNTELVVRLLRAACEKSPAALVAIARAHESASSAHKQARADVEREMGWKRDRDAEKASRYSDLLQRVQEFEDASGLARGSIAHGHVSAKRLGRAVNALARHYGPDQMLRDIRSAVEGAKRYQTRLESLAAEVATARDLLPEHETEATS